MHGVQLWTYGAHLITGHLRLVISAMACWSCQDPGGLHQKVELNMVDRQKLCLTDHTSCYIDCIRVQLARGLATNRHLESRPLCQVLVKILSDVHVFMHILAPLEMLLQVLE